MEQLSSLTVYVDPWMKVRQDEVRRADGTLGTYGVVEEPDFALVVPVERDGFWLVEQFRTPSGCAPGSFHMEAEGRRAKVGKRTSPAPSSAKRPAYVPAG